MKKKFFWAITFKGEIVYLYMTRQEARDSKGVDEKIVKIEVKIVK